MIDKLIKELIDASSKDNPEIAINTCVFDYYKKYNYEIVSEYLRSTLNVNFSRVLELYIKEKNNSYKYFQAHKNTLIKILEYTDWFEKLEKWVTLMKYEKSIDEIRNILEEFFVFLRYSSEICNENREIYYDMVADFLDTMY